jgi:hypothetical protein
MPALALQMVPQRRAPCTILRALKIIQILPARLRAAESLPVEDDIESFGGEKALLHGDEIIQAHAFRRDFHRHQASSHLNPPVGCLF